MMGFEVLAVGETARHNIKGRIVTITKLVAASDLLHRHPLRPSYNIW